MNRHFAIIGANIAGLASAIAIKEKRPDIDIIVYDKNGIWNKPCGAAISVEFYKFLIDKGIYLTEAEYSDEFITGSFDSPVVTMKSPFIVTNRVDLQTKLLDYAVNQQGVQYEQKFVKTTDIELFTAQTIVASGFTGISHTLLNRKWKQSDLCTIIRWDGIISPLTNGSSIDYPRKQVILIDNYHIGYGWIFIGAGSHINIGYGSIHKTPMRTVINQYYNFIDILNENYGFNLEFDDLRDFVSWGLPIPIKKKKIKVSHFDPNGIQFIGVGDALGMAHPTLGAGIEPAWLSAELLAQCLQSNGLIDTTLYQKLLWKNVRAIITPGRDYYYSRLFRSKFYKLIPYRLRKRLLNRLMVTHQPRLMNHWKVNPMFKPLEN